MRYKLDQRYGLCQSCQLPRLSTDGERVVCCACGDVSQVEEWNERIQSAAERVRRVSECRRTRETDRPT